ncbi:MAG: TolC family protein [Burkholderiales bacterium]
MKSLPVALVLVVLAWIHPVSAQVLSLQEAQQLALSAQPSLDAYSRAADAARSAGAAELQLPDPRLKLGLQNFPVTTADAFMINRDDMTMKTIGVMQDVVHAEKRVVQSARMNAEADSALAERGVAERQILRDVALTWWDAHAAVERMRLLRLIANEVRIERQVLTARLAAGGVETRELLALDTMIAMLEDQQQMALRDERKARALLGRWIGVAAERPFVESNPSLEESAKATIARLRSESRLDAHPLAATARAMEAVSLKEVERARLERKPDWSWEVMLGLRASSRADMLSFQVSIPLLWDTANRQDRRVAEKLALAERAHLLLQDRERQLAAEIQTGLVEWDSIIARERLFRSQLLPTSQNRLETALASYAAGKGPYSLVAEARRAVIDARMQLASIQAELRKAAVNLRFYE